MAILLIRLMGVVMVFVGALGIIYWFFAGAILNSNSPEHTWQSARALSAILFILLGVVIYKAGRPIGKFVGKDLKD